MLSLSSWIPLVPLYWWRIYLVRIGVKLIAMRSNLRCSAADMIITVNVVFEKRKSENGYYAIHQHAYIVRQSARIDSLKLIHRRIIAQQCLVRCLHHFDDGF